jgi:hypothetical protein
MSPALDPRTQRLRDAGFTYDARTDVWFNVDGRRALGGVSMRANTEEWLAAWLAGRERVHASPSSSSWTSSPRSGSRSSSNPV